jgi:hypothetical protein
MTITCCYCSALAVSGVDSIDRDEYAPVCAADLARLVSEFDMVAVDLVSEFAPCECGCDY